MPSFPHLGEEAQLTLNVCFRLMLSEGCTAATRKLSRGMLPRMLSCFSSVGETGVQGCVHVRIHACVPSHIHVRACMHAHAHECESAPDAEGGARSYDKYQQNIPCLLWLFRHKYSLYVRPIQCLTRPNTPKCPHKEALLFPHCQRTGYVIGPGSLAIKWINLKMQEA
jgi:hypothetical protein